MRNIVMLDFGSNSTRMAHCQVDENKQIKEVARYKEQTRLAAGMGATAKKLQPEALKRVEKALQTFVHRYQGLPNLTVYAIATAAVRQASNQAEFLQLVKRVAGVDVEVLSGQREAYYDCLGVAQSLPLTDCLVVDMGGGSVEFALMQDKKPKEYVSLPVGAVSLSERFNLRDQVTALDLDALQRVMLRYYRQLPWLRAAKDLPVVLIGGANRALVRNLLVTNDLRAMQGVTIQLSDYVALYRKWLGCNLVQRQATMGAEADRADIILGGLAPLVTLFDYLNPPKLVFSESGVREGVLAEIVANSEK